MIEKIARLLRRGDSVVWGQGVGEPVAVSEQIVAHRHDIGPLDVFVGAMFTDTIRAEHTDVLHISSYGALGSNRRLAEAGRLNIIPCHASRIGVSIERGQIPCDVAIVQLSASGPNGKPSMGPINDYIRAAMRRARVIIAEVNEQAPWTYGPEPPDLDRIALVINTSRPLVEVRSQTPTDIDLAIGAHVAAIVADGATLQVGYGRAIDSLLTTLRGHRDLGVHSGAIGDGILDLIECGVITNSHKAIDQGVTVSANLFGSERLLRFADRNPEIKVVPYEYTHDPGQLARIDNLVAINSAIEVDLTGATNAERVGSRYVGAVGGQVDFIGAASRSLSGCSIIALSSTADGGKKSRISAQIAPVTCARSEVDFVVTEYGAADLRGRSIRERVRRMILIAHPLFREQLERDSEAILRRGY
jgi:acyl-CoA hydrolase